MRTRVRFVLVILVVSLGAVPTLLAQAPGELDSTARARIEEARKSMVVVKVENEPAQRVSQAFGILIRNDLVATDASVLIKGSRLSVTAATNQRTLRVLSPGHYFLAYILLEKQAEIEPVRLGDSEAVAVNDKVYMVDDEGAITEGTVTGKITIKGDPVFLISLVITSSNKGAPIFNRNGEVIGLAVQNPDGGAGLAWASSLLAKLTHLGEPGVGMGAGDGRLQSGGPTANGNAFSTSNVDEKPVRLRSPSPRYTEEARANNTQGTVTLRVLVGADGRVQLVRVIRGLPHGLTERAIAAAREAEFKPAMKDGKPVPCWIVLEMAFNLR